MLSFILAAAVAFPQFIPVAQGQTGAVVVTQSVEGYVSLTATTPATPRSPARTYFMQIGCVADVDGYYSLITAHYGNGQRYQSDYRKTKTSPWEAVAGESDSPPLPTFLQSSPEELDRQFAAVCP